MISNNKPGRDLKRKHYENNAKITQFVAERFVVMNFATVNIECIKYQSPVLFHLDNISFTVVLRRKFLVLKDLNTMFSN